MRKVCYTICYAQHRNTCATDPCVTQNSQVFRGLTYPFTPATHLGIKHHTGRVKTAENRRSCDDVKAIVGSLGVGSVTPAVRPAR